MQSWCDSMNESISISLEDIWSLVKRNIKFIIASALVFSVISFVYTNYFVAKKYTSNATMIASFTTLEQKVDDMPNSVSTAQTEAAKALANSYTAILKSKYTAKKINDIISTSWRNVSVEQIKGSISISSVNDTEVLSISITTVDPQLSYDICKAFIDISPEIIAEKSFGRLLELEMDEEPPKASSYPNVKKNIFIGFLIGAAVSACIVFALYFLNNKVKGEDDIENRYNVPILGTVPSFTQKKKSLKKRKANMDSSKSESDSHKNFFVIEAYKNIRTNLMYTFTKNDCGNVVAVSGAEAAAGKSVTSANLSVAFAQSSFRVLLIDADMRRPAQQKLFKRPNVNGLSLLLSGQTKFEDAVQKEVVPNLDLITAGPIPPNPSELLSSPEMDKLLKYVFGSYDCVIVDTPPVNYVTDCLTIANKINGIVLVARQGHTEYYELNKAIDSINSINGKILGIVVDDVIASEHKSKYYHSKYYKGYQN